MINPHPGATTTRRGAQICRAAENGPTTRFDCDWHPSLAIIPCAEVAVFFTWRLTSAGLGGLGLR